MTDDDPPNPRSDLTDEQLETWLLAGLNSGPGRPMTAADWEYVRAEAKRRAGITRPGE